MEQLTLVIGPEPQHETALVLDPRLREELIALIAVAVLAVDEARKGGRDDGIS